MRFQYARIKSETLRNNPKRGIDFEKAQEIFTRPYYQDERADDQEQRRVIGWVGGRLYTLICEDRKDGLGEYYYLVTLWRSTREERELYEAKS